jgi:hypothetical protein
LKSIGVDSKHLITYRAGEYTISPCESTNQLQGLIGELTLVDIDTIVDYVFRKSVQYLIDIVDWNKPETIFGNIEELLTQDPIDPASIYNVIRDKLVYANVDIAEGTMQGILPLLVDIYVALVAYDLEE